MTPPGPPFLILAFCLLIFDLFFSSYNYKAKGKNQKATINDV